MSKIDLVIPTHNRINLLKRILDFYQSYGNDFNFIIADSSNSNNKEFNKKLVRTYSNLNILYIDKFPEKLEQHYKFAEMVKYLKSEFCVFCPDDDFIIPNAIRECVTFLEKNPDYSAAHGTYISFEVQRQSSGDNKFRWRLLFSPHSISSSNPTNRLSSHLIDFILTLWAVRRTETVKLCYKEFSKAKIDPYLLPILGELLPDALTAIFGKVKSLNTLYGARQYLSQIRGYFPSLIDAKKAGKFDKSYSSFKNSLVNNLNKKNNFPGEKINKTIDKIMEDYIKYSYQEHLVNNIYLLLKNAPPFISRGLKLLHADYLFSKSKKSPIGLIDKPSSKYFSDFNNIQKIVLKYS